MVIKTGTVKEPVLALVSGFWPILELFTRPDWCPVPVLPVEPASLVWFLKQCSYPPPFVVSQHLTNAWALVTLDFVIQWVRGVGSRWIIFYFIVP